MGDMLLINGTVVGRDRLIPNGFVHICDGKIKAFGEQGEIPEITPDMEVIDTCGAYIAPGFVDIHCHGGGGVWSFHQPYEFAVAHLLHGTTSILPTLTYNESREETRQGVLEIKNAIYSDAPYRSAIVGIHLEGPYINKKYGAVTSPIRPVDPEEYNELLSLAGEEIKLWTLAPELDGQYEFAIAAARYGIALSVGHSEATAEQIYRLVPLGLQVGCHCTNASGTTPSPSSFLGTREVGVDEAVLVHDDLYAEVIPDKLGIHVRPLMLKLIHKTKGTDRVIIITDGMPDSGLADPDEPDVNYNYKGALAGSKLTMDGAVRNMMKHASVGIVDAFRMSATNPAVVIGMEHEIGSIEQGKWANIILVDEEIHVQAVILRGEMIK
ncbi:N-acetylglucosamine-6-phosphate deacetylase [Cohnella sp. WQ 127256]|uniref:N-acetylglucosamine-6-phosphate deacetylase n=1 Tax=Cohnella sp. WQ 127256 TaxID=2938790 RepID=UPI00211881E8|nr:amidohydrolase family protein [Cohnella sp. WQ 127256]